MDVLTKLARLKARIERIETQYEKDIERISPTGLGKGIVSAQYASVIDAVNSTLDIISMDKRETD